MDNCNNETNKLDPKYLQEWLKRDLKAEHEARSEFYRTHNFSVPKPDKEGKLYGDYDSVEEWLKHCESPEYQAIFK